MNPVNLKYLSKGDTIDGVLLVKTAEVRTSSTGSKYLDITVMDATGELNGKGWDWGDNPAPAPGSVIRVKGMVTEFNSRLQLRVDKMREAKEEETDWNQLVPCAPEEPEQMLEELFRTARSLTDSELSALTEWMLDQRKEQLRIWPAAVSFHHAERSGLAHHTVCMVRAGEAMLKLYPFLDRSLLLCGVILHDLAKIEEISANAHGVAVEYSVDGLLMGHIIRGVQRVAEAGEALGIAGEKIMLVQHMILAHHELPEYGSPRKAMFPEAEMLHHLDILDARMYDMKHALAGVKPGEFSERVRSLDNRRLYKPPENDDNRDEYEG